MESHVDITGNTDRILPSFTPNSKGANQEVKRELMGRCQEHKIMTQHREVQFYELPYRLFTTLQYNSETRDVSHGKPTLTFM